jgi:hypothetical protein
MKTWEELKNLLLDECERDEVGLWFIIRYLRDDLGMNDLDQIRRSTLRMVRELLETGNVVAGDYAPPGSGLPAWMIVSWDGTIDDILARVGREWDRLGREPNIGEIVTLQAKSEDGGPAGGP